MHFRPFRNLHKIITTCEHPTEAQDDNVHQAMFEILPLAAGISKRLQPLHQGTRHNRHAYSFYLRETCAAVSILTPSFYKGRSAFAVSIPWSWNTCLATSIP